MNELMNVFGQVTTPQSFDQIPHDPYPPRRLKIVRRRAMLPDGVTNGLENVGPQVRLHQEASQISGQHVTGPVLADIDAPDPDKRDQRCIGNQEQSAPPRGLERGWLRPIWRKCG